MAAETPTRAAFISYASADREKAEAICQSLEERGHQCWIAPRDVRAGREYADEIIRGIQDSRCLVLVLSEAANESTFVRREVERAVSKKKPVFPFRVEEVLPSPSLELFISTTHWIDAWSGNLVGHVDRLARDLADDTSVARATAVSRRIVRRRQAPKWIAAGMLGFIGIVGAIVVANKLTSGPNPAELVVRGADSQEVMAEMQKAKQGLIDATGVDPASITKDDLTVTTFTRFNSSEVGLKIKQSADLAALAAYGDLFIAIGEGAYRRVGRGMEDSISASRLDQQDLAAAKFIRIRYDLENGASLGPFEFPLSAGNAVLDTYKATALATSTWMDFHGGSSGYATFARLADFYPAVRRVRWGSDSGQLHFVVEVPPPPSSDRAEIQRNSRSYWLDYLPYEQGAGQAFVQLDFYDGTSSPVRKTELTDDKPGAYESLVLRPNGTSPEEQPPLLVATFDALQGIIRYRPLVPCMTTTEVLYSFDDQGLLKAQMQNRGGRGADVYPARGFSFEGPVADGPVRLLVRLDDGTELGPFTYSLQGAADLGQAANKQSLLADLSEAVVAYRVTPAVPPLAEGADPKEANEHYGRVMNRQLRMMTFISRGVSTEETQKVIDAGNVVLCLPAEKSTAWSAVREVRLGIAQDDLSVSVKLGAENATEGVPASMWFATLPYDARAAYLQLVFRDGSTSDTIRVPIIEDDRNEP